MSDDQPMLENAREAGRKVGRDPNGGATDCPIGFGASLPDRMQWMEGFGEGREEIDADRPQRFDEPTDPAPPDGRTAEA